MWKLPGAFWIGAALICLSVQHAPTTESRYSAIFKKMEAEFESLKGVTDPVEIRRRHFEKMKETGNFDRDPCDDFLEYSCGGYFKDLNSNLPDIEPALYNYEIFKFQMKHLLQSEDAVFQGDTAQHLRTFYQSCLKFDDLQKADSVLTKFFAIIDKADDWSDAVVTLHNYGINVFYNISYDDGIKISPLPSLLLYDSLQDLRQFMTDFQILNADEAAQRAAQFREVFGRVKPETNHSPGITYNLTELKETFSALHIQQLLLLYQVGEDTAKVTILDHAFLENLNRQLLSANRSMVDLLLKLVVVERIYEKLDRFKDTVPETSKFEKCFDVAYKYFEPVLNRVYVQNFVAKEIGRNVSYVLGVVLNSYTETLSDNRLKNSLRNDADYVLLGFEDSTNNYLYLLLSLDVENEFPDNYFDVIFSDSAEKTLCLSHYAISFGKANNDKLVKLSELKNTQLCGEAYFKSIPINKLSIPYYHIAYPDFWNYASLAWAYYWHVAKPKEEALAETDVEKKRSYSSETIWKTLASSYSEKIRGLGQDREELHGYEGLNLTPMQAFFVSMVQNACQQANGYQVLQLMNFINNTLIGDLFSCKAL